MIDSSSATWVKKVGDKVCLPRIQGRLKRMDPSFRAYAALLCLYLHHTKDIYLPGWGMSNTLSCQHACMLSSFASASSRASVQCL